MYSSTSFLSRSEKVNKESDLLVKLLEDKAKLYIKTDKKRIAEDKINQNIVYILLKSFENEGRFEGKYSLNKTEWNTLEELREWENHNMRYWYNPMTGEASLEKREGWISPIPGDILSYQGAGKIPLFEHFGIYIGNIKGIGIMVEVRDGLPPRLYDINAPIKEECHHINMIQLNVFKKFLKFPLHIIPTIKYNKIYGKWMDTRVIRRQVSLLSCIKMIRYGWLFGVDSSKDQTCQSFVNFMLFKRLYTVQIYNLLPIVFCLLYLWLSSKM